MQGGHRFAAVAREEALVRNAGRVILDRPPQDRALKPNAVPLLRQSVLKLHAQRNTRLARLSQGHTLTARSQAFTL
jgi:hypothetical protein